MHGHTNVKYICCAFVSLDDKLYKMHGTNIRCHSAGSSRPEILHLTLVTESPGCKIIPPPPKYVKSSDQDLIASEYTKVLQNF